MASFLINVQETMLGFLKVAVKPCQVCVSYNSSPVQGLQTGLHMQGTTRFCACDKEQYPQPERDKQQKKRRDTYGWCAARIDF